MRKLQYCLIAITALFSLLSCENFLTQVSENDTSVLNQFQTEEDVEAAVNGMHGQFRDVMGAYLQNYRDRGMLLDGYGVVTWKQFASLDLTNYPANTPEFSWIFEYKAISSINLVIAHQYRAEMSEDRHRFYLGQAYFMRAYMYFHIIRLWGDAPLILDYENTDEQGRTSWRTIANAILDDLNKAVEYLPTEDLLRDSRGAAIRNKQIPSRGTAYALLAHVYAWIAGYGQEPALYAEGIKAAQQVINDPNYQLAADPEEVCTKVLKGNSPEGILEVAYSFEKGEYKSYGSYLAGAVQRWPVHDGTTPATIRKYFLKNTTVEGLYSPGDKRLAAYFKDFYEMAAQPVNITRGCAYIQIWRHIRHYSGGTQQGKPQTYDMNEIIIRLPDIILLKAEMEAAIGNEAQAIADLNIIRKRAGVPDYTENEGDLKQAIQLERDKELLLQTLVRYFDHCRNHTYHNLNGGYKTLTEQDVKDGALFMPVSSDAISNNPMMKQTVYWNKQY